MASTKGTMAHRLTIGTTFYSHFADGNPKWEVVKARGADTWECRISDDSPDYQGTKKVFGGEEIRREIAYYEMFANMANEHDLWWNSQAVGAIVHYANGFGQYVRGVIVSEGVGCENKMRPTDLVGKWQDYDLPHINAAGNLRESYHVRQIREGNTMRPNYSNMVEAVGVRNGETDPRGQEVIDIRPPTRDGEQEEAQRLNGIREQVLTLLQNVPHEAPYSEILRVALQQVRTLLTAADLR